MTDKDQDEIEEETEQDETEELTDEERARRACYAVLLFD